MSNTGEQHASSLTGTATEKESGQQGGYHVSPHRKAPKRNKDDASLTSVSSAKQNPKIQRGQRLFNKAAKLEDDNCYTALEEDDKDSVTSVSHKHGDVEAMDIDLDTLDAPSKSRVDSTTSAKKNNSESIMNKTTKRELKSDTNMNQTKNEHDETETKMMNDNEMNKNKNESKAQDIEEDDQDLVDKLNEKSAGLLPGLRWVPVGSYF